MNNRAGNVVALLVCLVLCWEVLYLIAGARALSPPLDTARNAGLLLASADFWNDVGETARAFAAALALSLAIGLPLGLALGLSRLAADAAEPVLVGFYAVPKLPLFPIVLVTFGLGIWSKIVFGALHGIVPVTIFTMNAVRALPHVYLKSARVLRWGPWRIARRILIPASLPEIFAGLQIGFSVTMLGTILGEMFLSKRGIGYFLMRAIGLGQTLDIMSATLLLVTFAVSANAGLSLLRHRLEPGARMFTAHPLGAARP